MNINIETNVIFQCFIIEQSISLLNINLLEFIWINKQNVYYYDVYKMCYQLQNSWNIEKKDINIFYIIDKKELFLILSISSMQFKHIWINTAVRTWYFNINEHTFKLFIAKNFIKVLQEEFTVYAFIMYNIIKELTVKH